jgi:hypothetical protein
MLQFLFRVLTKQSQSLLNLEWLLNSSCFQVVSFRNIMTKEAVHHQSLRSFIGYQIDHLKLPEVFSKISSKPISISYANHDVILEYILLFLKHMYPYNRIFSLI